MTTDVELSSIEVEAHAWVRRLHSGAATVADARALESWCARSPTHAAAFDDASRLWRALGFAGQGLRDDERRLLRARRAGPIGRRALLGGALAASAAGLLLTRPPLSLWPSLSELAADYRTGAGEQRSIAVASDVSVQLNSRTSMSVSLGPTADVIQLIAGEASFRTGAARSKPLDVDAASGRASARAAHFDVRVTGARVCVTCLSGEHVRVAVGAATVDLAPRERVVYDAGALGRVAPVDPAVAAAWQEGVLVFEMTPLAEVIEELNRHRNGRIVLLNAEAGRAPVNARFRIDRPNDALLQIERGFGLRGHTLPGGLVLLT
ncbi:FecR domain-containing protein [Rhodoplanes sp. TEM]|uniref:FecR domain-containing protein n=1 Tax=Rhodoplanes tepidamans TaxID=200616 RepID=A0ABT5JBH5_RHOTP|nr:MULTISPECIES: FecR domain-containing protein [Rhodoplanes]MDC7787035.1 FecR domain-containing protein [Rhodoplanes tepidamans]MDC7985267.1 FecR domain-containing protein [Rhodoplanes sp. TEM]MDQ0354239.1 transmembrane sensor [Rhodoplanes tepidamans]